MFCFRFDWGSCNTLCSDSLSLDIIYTFMLALLIVAYPLYSQSAMNRRQKKKKMYLSVCFLSSKDMPSFHVEISYFKSLYIKASTVFALLLKSYSIDLNLLFKNVAITLKSQSEMLESFFPPPFFLLKHFGSCLL